MASNHLEEGAKLSFDLIKQFTTLAVGGIAFVVGLSYSTPLAISPNLLWITILVFGISAVCGLVFLMHSVATLSIEKSYDVYTNTFRALSIVQILLVVGGVIMLCVILYWRPPPKQATTDSKVIQVQLLDQVLTYPLEADKNYTIEIENGKIKFSATK